MTTAHTITNDLDEWIKNKATQFYQSENHIFQAQWPDDTVLVRCNLCNESTWTDYDDDYDFSDLNHYTDCNDEDNVFKAEIDWYSTSDEIAENWEIVKQQFDEIVEK